jgi:hypothetical protein
LDGSRFWGGGEGQDGVYLIVGSLVFPVLLLPYRAFLVGICYKSGVWMNLESRPKHVVVLHIVQNYSTLKKFCCV